MLKNIKIKGYKSFSEIEIKLASLMVLFAPNATGKSNFLDALQLLLRLANRRSLISPYRSNLLESFTLLPSLH